jgi:hypothetical protein
VIDAAHPRQDLAVVKAQPQDAVIVSGARTAVGRLRDSKDREGPALVLSDPAWSVFIHGIKQGRFDL